MKKRTKKIIALTLCATFISACFAGCGKDKTPQLPDYSSNTERFEFFTYRSPNDGKFYIDGLEYYAGQSFRTVERYKEMLDCGFTMLYNNERILEDTDWETSECKKIMENAYAAGFTKILNLDWRISQIIDSGKTVFLEENVGTVEGYDPDPTHYSYPSRDALDAQIKEYMSMYVDMPGFYGLVLLDEPVRSKAHIYGQVYQSVKRVAKDLGMDYIYIHSNFLPIGAAAKYYGTECTEEHADEQSKAQCPYYHDAKEKYADYLGDFFNEAQFERVSADTYAFRGGLGFYPGMYPSIQVLREEADKIGAELSYCLQSFHQYSGSEEAFRKVDKSMMYLEMNSLVGFGASNFAYYTYMPHTETTVGGDVGDGSFLTRDGERTNIWYYGQQLMSEMQEFAPVVLSYDFKGAQFVYGDVIQFGVGAYQSGDTIGWKEMTWDNSYQFNLLKSVKIDNDIALITELKDEKNDLYMYMVQNVIDPVNGKSGRTDMNVEVDFGAEYTYVAEFDCGNLRYVPLENGVYKNALSAGYAVYLVPLK